MNTSGQRPSACKAVHNITIGGVWVLMANRRCKFSADLFGKWTPSFCSFTNFLIWNGFSSEKTKFGNWPLSCKRNNFLPLPGLTFIIVHQWAFSLFGSSMAFAEAHFSICVASVLVICSAHVKFFYHCDVDFDQIWPSLFGSFLVLLSLFFVLFLDAMQYCQYHSTEQWYEKQKIYSYLNAGGL